MSPPWHGSFSILLGNNSHSYEGSSLSLLFPAFLEIWWYLYRINSLDENGQFLQEISRSHPSRKGKGYSNNSMNLKCLEQFALDFLMKNLHVCLFKISNHPRLRKAGNQISTFDIWENISRQYVNLPWEDEIFSPLCLMLSWFSNSFERIFINYLNYVLSFIFGIGFSFWIKERTIDLIYCWCRKKVHRCQKSKAHNSHNWWIFCQRVRKPRVVSNENGWGKFLILWRVHIIWAVVSPMECVHPMEDVELFEFWFPAFLERMRSMAFCFSWEVPCPKT